MKDYSLRTDLVADLIAGLTVGIMHIPQGMKVTNLFNPNKRGRDRKTSYISGVALCQTFFQTNLIQDYNNILY